VSVAPNLTVREDLSRAGRSEAYQVLRTPCKFICGMAEHRPFVHDSVDFVRMNSVLDHLWDTHLGLREIMRVLKPNGLVFWGVSTVHEKSTMHSLLEKAKDLAKSVLRRRDHHIWHPTSEDVDLLTQSVGLVKVREMPCAHSVNALFRKPTLG